MSHEQLTTTPTHESTEQHPFDMESASGGASMTAPAFQLMASPIQMAENPCTDRIPADFTEEDSRELGKRRSEHASLERKYTRQTMWEMLTTTRDSEKGEYDPVTQFLKSIYSPADEGEKIGDLYDQFPALESACKRAFVEQTDDAYLACAEQMMDASENIPDTSPLPKLPKKLTPWEIVKTLKDWGNILKNYEVDPDTAQEGVCTPEKQAESGIGKVLYWSIVWDQVDFIGTDGSKKTAKYFDVSEWIKVDGQDFIAFSDLSHVEARIASRKE